MKKEEFELDEEMSDKICSHYNYMGELIDNLLVEEIGNPPKDDTYDVLANYEYNKKVLDLLDNKWDEIFNKLKERHGKEIKKRLELTNDDEVDLEINDIMTDRQIGAGGLVQCAFRQSKPHQIIKAIADKSDEIIWKHYNLLDRKDEEIKGFICPPKLLEGINELSNVLKETNYENISMICFCDLDLEEIVQLETYFAKTSENVLCTINEQVEEFIKKIKKSSFSNLFENELEYFVEDDMECVIVFSKFPINTHHKNLNN